MRKIGYVLCRSIRKKGTVGDVVKVAPGFGRYLERIGHAKRVTEQILAELADKKLVWQKEEQKFVEIAQGLIERVKNVSLILKKQSAQGGKLYEAVRPEDVVAAYKLHGIEVDKNSVKIDSQIKHIGKYTIIIHAYGNYETAVEIEVISMNQTV